MDEAQVLEKFRRNGFFTLKGFFSPDEAKLLLEAIKNTGTSSSELLTRGAMTFRSQAFMHDKFIQEFISQQKIVNLLKIVAGPDLWVRWDQAVAKGPGADIFPWHQDNGYNGLRTEFYQLWISLTNATADNGGLLLQPGSHKKPLPHKKVGHEMVYTGIPESPILIEAEPGDITLFSSFLLHSTNPNTTQDDRWAYVIEYMPLDDYDPTLKPPYFVVARDGKSCPEFVDSQKGSKNIFNRLKYIVNKNPY